MLLQVDGYGSETLYPQDYANGYYHNDIKRVRGQYQPFE
jgi:hypothetical protein